MEQENQKTHKQKITLSLPGAVVIAGLLIAGAVLFGSSKTAAVPTQAPAPEEVAGDLEQLASITSADHIRGNPDAPIKIVEYSDTECPFCKRFHDTMKQVMAEYGDSGKVAWVYRNMPLDGLHQKARSEAVALECAADQGGNDSFWKYTDRLYEVTPSNDGLDPSELPKIAEFIGLDVAAFNTCLTSGKFDAKIEAEVQNGAATGGNGTPWSILVDASDKKTSINGAQPYPVIKDMIDKALADSQ